MTAKLRVDTFRSSTAAALVQCVHVWSRVRRIRTPGTDFGFCSIAIPFGQGNRASSPRRSGTPAQASPTTNLFRRNIESYIPGPALNAWAYVGTGRTARRRRGPIVDAFCRLGETQRHHFNLKGGFAADATRTDANAGDLYDGVAESDRMTLSSGFGSHIGDLFQTGRVAEQDLRQDSGWSEMRSVVNRLISLMR